MGDFNYWTTARLRPGVSPAKAQAELNVVQAAISKQIAGDLDLHASLIPLQERMVGDVRQGLVLLMAAVGAVLLVLCVNLANLSLARAAGRARDAAIRTALGASRGRLLGAIDGGEHAAGAGGGALGVAAGLLGMRALLAAAPIDLPRLQRSPRGRRVLLFALAISLVTGLMFGALPALRSAASAPRGDAEIGRPRQYRRARRIARAQRSGEPRSGSQRGAAGHGGTADRELRPPHDGGQGLSGGARAGHECLAARHEVSRSRRAAPRSSSACWRRPPRCPACRAPRWYRPCR